MKIINQHYVDGQFRPSTGTDKMDIINPSDESLIGQVVLGNEQDMEAAIVAASAALPSFSQTSRKQRMGYLQRLHDALMERLDDLQEVTTTEYGATVQRSRWSNQYAAETFLYFKEILKDFSFERRIGQSAMAMVPVGVTGIMTAWNANSGSICVKLAAAIAAGCTVVIKPSEMSAMQSQVLVECFDRAGLPGGVINMVHGRGDILGTVLSTHPAVAKILFTGSTMVGKIIARNAVDTMKRVTLELSGKSPNIILNDADLNTAIPMAINAAFMNSGQACIAGTRLLVPEADLPEVKDILLKTMATQKVGDPRDEHTVIGPMASQKQFDRIQHYIRRGIDEGAEVLVGGLGKPDGFQNGFYVKPTIFTGVSNDMTIAQEEIFGPVLSVITYKTEEEAIAIANDTVYGLHAYVSSSDIERAQRVAAQINAGRVAINTISHDALAPFGGFKQSGLGREGGLYGLEEQLEPKVIIS
ncbi:aldehyde dehydrogenase family protein [Sphingobacterium thalpophilum]|uniref:aldehyde dehydrogenase (NAD(+)) n=1 Tax=Sphingobacterium thalpophilum TaxID=259 RepID=A0A4U9VUN3_9SPHI|nr:aldehyde dehydrogenase family protein [Sphingobacterium thalpophilum]VTR51255.1 Putative aldehyde dehydrogenase SA1924 [Sphingobacterium thalpophilum]